MLVHLAPATTSKRRTHGHLCKPTTDGWACALEMRICLQRGATHLHARAPPRVRALRVSAAGRRRARAAASASGAAARETRGGGRRGGPDAGATRDDEGKPARRATASASARRARRAPPPAVAGIGRRGARAAPRRARWSDAPSTRRPSARAPSMSVESAPYITPSASSVPSTWSSAHVPEIGAAYILARRSSSRWQWSATTCRRGWSRRVDGGDARGAACAQGGAASAAAAAARRAGRSARRARTSASGAIRARAGGASASRRAAHRTKLRVPAEKVGGSIEIAIDSAQPSRKVPNPDDGRTQPHV